MPSEPAPLVVLRPPGREPYVVTIDRLTALVRAARVLRMGRLAKALDHARGSVNGLETEVLQDVQKLVERVEYVRDRKNKAFGKQHGVLDADVSDLAEMEKDLEDFGKNEETGASTGNAYAGTSPPKL